MKLVRRRKELAYDERIHPPEWLKNLRADVPNLDDELKELEDYYGHPLPAASINATITELAPGAFKKMAGLSIRAAAYTGGAFMALGPEPLQGLAIGAVCGLGTALFYSLHTIKEQGLGLGKPRVSFSIRDSLGKRLFVQTQDPVDERSRRRQHQ